MCIRRELENYYDLDTNIRFLLNICFDYAGFLLPLHMRNVLVTITPTFLRRDYGILYALR